MLLAELSIQLYYTICLTAVRALFTKHSRLHCSAGGGPTVKSEPGRGPAGSAGFAPGAVRPNFVGKPFRPAGSQTPLSVGPAANYRPAKLKARADTVYKVGLPNACCCCAACTLAHAAAASEATEHLCVDMPCRGCDTVFGKVKSKPLAR